MKLKIYDETTGLLMAEVDEDLGETYPGKRWVREIPGELRQIEGTETRVITPATQVYEDCLYYHPYSTEERIALYKDKLAATDYAIIKIAEGAATREEYAELIAQRAVWRQKINELEGGGAFDFIFEEAPDLVRPVGG